MSLLCSRCSKLPQTKRDLCSECYHDLTNEAAKYVYVYGGATSEPVYDYKPPNEINHIDSDLKNLDLNDKKNENLITSDNHCVNYQN